MPANEIDSLSSLPSTFCSGYSAIPRDASGTASPGARLPQLPCARALCRLTSFQWGVTAGSANGVAKKVEQRLEDALRSLFFLNIHEGGGPTPLQAATGAMK